MRPNPRDAPVMNHTFPDIDISFQMPPKRSNDLRGCGEDGVSLTGAERTSHKNNFE
jgi:hypothetical protein